MIAYSFDINGKYTGQVVMQADPMNPGEFLMPAMATNKAPPTGLAENSFAKFDYNKNDWEIVYIIDEQEQATPPSQEQLIQQKWGEIRTKRNDLLRSLVDEQVPYINWGDYSQQNIDRFKTYRLALLNVPQDIQTKIESGELSSVLDIDVATYSWPELAPI
jgi:hypothetical protein